MADKRASLLCCCLPLSKKAKWRSVVVKFVPVVAGRADREADIGFTTGRATYRPTHTGWMQLHREKINNTGDFDTAVYFN